VIAEEPVALAVALAAEVSLLLLLPGMGPVSTAAEEETVTEEALATEAPEEAAVAREAIPEEAEEAETADCWEHR